MTTRKWLNIGILTLISGIIVLSAVTSVGQSVKNLFQSVANRRAGIDYEGDPTPAQHTSTVPKALTAALPAVGDNKSLLQPVMPLARPNIAYSHAETLGGAPAALEARWQALQQACLSDTALDCIVVNANFKSDVPMVTRPGDDKHYYQPNIIMGKLSVRVAPAGVLRFLTNAGSGLKIIARETKAEDLNTAVADLVGRQKLLEQQRDRLMAIQSRTTDYQELSYFARELSRIQTDIEDMMSRQRGISDITTRQSVNLVFQTDDIMPDLTPPTPKEPSIWERNFGSIGRQGVEFYLSFAALLLRFVVFVLPTFLICGLIFWQIAKRMDRSAEARLAHQT